MQKYGVQIINSTSSPWTNRLVRPSRLGNQTVHRAGVFTGNTNWYKLIRKPDVHIKILFEEPL